MAVVKPLVLYSGKIKQLQSGDTLPGGGGGAFTSLTDVPASYTGAGLKFTRVNAGETALEFVTLAGGGDELQANKDASGGYAGLTLLKINFKNVLGTFISFLTNSNTAARTYTFQDRNGTIADLADITTAQARAGHTGTQSADTLTDGTTNKAFLATERTKLTGIATSATANSSDATLLARGNHTGTQVLATISDAGTMASQSASAVAITGGIVTVNNASFKILDTGGDHTLRLRPIEDLSADRTLSLTLNNADRSLTVAGDATITGTNTGDNATNTQYSGLAASKQDTLVSATNIKTVNGSTLLGSGNLVVSGGASATTVETNIGTTPKFTGKFTITDAAISPTSKILCWQAPGPYTGKGTRADEAEMQPVQVIAVEPNTGSAVVKWQTPPIAGLYPMLTNSPTLGAGTSANNGTNRDVQMRACRVNRVKGNIKFSYMVLS